MKKKISYFITSFIFIILSIISFAAETVKLQVLATSDLHGRFMPYEYATASENKNGSLVQISTLIKKLRQENPNTILLDNGDNIQDNSHEIFLKESITPMILAMNYLKYDTFTAGNHEFNFGVSTLDSVLNKFDGDFLAANLYKDNKKVFNSYKIIKKDGVRIAIIGVVTPHIKKWDAENLKDYKVSNPVEEVKVLIPELKKKADIIVVSAHMPLDEEYGDGDSARQIANSNPDVVAVIAGHEHSLKNERALTGAVLIEPAKYGEYLSKIEINVTKENGKWLVKDREKDIIAENIQVKAYPADEELVKELTPFHKKALADASVVIGELKGGALVDKDEIKGIPSAQLKPSAMIDFINEVQSYYTKADVSSAAVFRNDANMFPGPIKKSDVALIYKYDNTLRAYRMNGAQLKKYMEWSASYYNTFKPGDLTISFNENIRGYNYDIFSGVIYEINISKPVGQRIQNLRKQDGSPVRDSDTFVVAVNDYRGKSTLLAEKGGLFKPGEIELVVDLAQTMGDKGRIRDLIGEYIKTVKGGIVTPEVSQNWLITGYKWDKDLHQKTVNLINQGKLLVPSSSDGRTSNVKSITVEDLDKISQ